MRDFKNHKIHCLWCCDENLLLTLVYITTVRSMSLLSLHTSKAALRSTVATCFFNASFLNLLHPRKYVGFSCISAVLTAHLCAFIEKQPQKHGFPRWNKMPSSSRHTTFSCRSRLSAFGLRLKRCRLLFFMWSSRMRTRLLSKMMIAVRLSSPNLVF